ncbi:ferredoxin [Rhodococcus sp. ACPA4]|uniref:Ferredoxin n=2 Tax=Nocardiaceae TaxID=85025 RepID=A0A652YQ42_NOCGL|nr:MULTISPECIES: ferredoxin [Rhodococcus]NMD64114.1 ferredoxin [Nocardia globerula]MCE4265601.1 ferredoxin [Rhodococcus globerulus]MDV6270931.1 ferredoxin [Rhodococcus globerulus]MDV8064875.1 ferredoxin [Rhodococcus sp. IEGM 1366]NRI68100.1 ferredoxin [Rhodococcus sp. MS16]
MRIHVDQDICQGHTICSMVAPDLFQLRDEDGHAYAIDGDVPAELEGVAREAMLSCPERAIVEISEHAIQEA